MTHSIDCLECFKTIRYTDKHVGKTIACPECKARLTLTSPDDPGVIESADPLEFEEADEFGSDIDNLRGSAPPPRARGKRSQGRSKKKPPAPTGIRNPLVIGLIAAAVLGGGVLILVVVLAFVFLRGNAADNPQPLAHNDIPAVPQPVETQVSPPTVQPLPAPAPGPQPVAVVPSEPVVPPVAAAITRIELPGQIEDVVVGGAGRYLVLGMADASVQIFDVAQRELVAPLPIRSEGRALAASRRHLFLVQSSPPAVQRVDLPSGANDETIQFATLASMDSPAAGSHSEGPLIVRVRVGGIAPTRNRYEWSVIDPDTLLAEPLALQSPDGDSDFVNDVTLAPFVCSSPDGRLISMWRTGVSPTGLQLFRLSDDFSQAELLYEHVSVNYARPDALNRLVVASNSIRDTNLKVIENSNDNVPVGAGQLFLRRQGHESDRWALHNAGSRDRLAELPTVRIGELKYELGQPWRLRGHNRVHVLLQHRCIVSIPTSNDELVVYNVDLRKLIEGLDSETIIALSVPPTHATPGQELTYQLDAVSGRQGPLTYALDYGPDGMSVTPEGQLTWSVPQRFQEQEASVIIAIDTPNGERGYHSFVLKIPE